MMIAIKILDSGDEIRYSRLHEMILFLWSLIMMTEIELYMHHEWLSDPHHLYQSPSEMGDTSS